MLAVLIFSRKGPHPATYKLSEPWTHEPILWAAVDEVVPGGGHHGTVRPRSVWEVAQVASGEHGTVATVDPAKLPCGWA